MSIHSLPAQADRPRRPGLNAPFGPPPAGPVQTPAIAPRATPPAPAPHAAPPAAARPAPVPPVLAPAPRRWAGPLGFAVMVLIPLALAGWYLFSRAADQWGSTLSFAVERGQAPAPTDLLEGMPMLAAFSGGGASETALLRDYLTSQALVERVEDRLGLSTLWAVPGDPVFAYDPTGTIEDLTRYWPRMVHLREDGTTGVIHVSVRAFLPGDAAAIAAAIHDESAAMVNRLADQARAEALRFATAELAAAEDRLARARGAMADFRSETGVIDPAAEMVTETGVLGALQQELAAALVEAGMLDTDVAGASARNTVVTRARAEEAARRVAVLRARIAEERAAVGSGEARDYAGLLARYEALAGEEEFARAAWTAARTGFEAARAELARQGFYLASFAAPSRAERAVYPRRGLILAGLGLGLVLAWAVAALALSALRDRA